MNNHPFGEIIYAYTRKQAIADGVQVDISTTAQETIRL
jgi:type I site-specific restriction endonuclease